MDNYEGLQAVYDELVSGVDFDGWIEYVEALAGHFGYCPGSVLDLACGTGNTIIPFARKGCRAIGMDLSPGMISRAREKSREMGLDIEYHIGDMREFLLERPVELVTCFHDGLNYLTEPDHLETVFKNSSRNLVEGGMFIFDLNAVGWIGGSDGLPVVIDEKDRTIVYQADFDSAGLIWTVNLICFLRDGQLYRKFSETHREKGYHPEDIEKMLKRAGFLPLAVYDAFTFSPPHYKSKRHFYVARKS